MSSKGEDSSSMADRMVKEDTASVIPVERKLVKTMVVKTIISAFTPSGSTRGSEPTGGNGNGGRVHPTRR
ncbi:hypothetical protein F2Q70_00031021 [Brassica cretica]|uniref:Uncharacterized protein n=1 Tax=Brassica cretica TaxID=69181 RepID=A0A8S9N6B8_BRACR|nr:hypothetical protein F2Q70_00031021 [Brassica cretica]KAF3488977.1 hypothetical protein F2Q69_00054734 [Brassica cretica]